MGGPRDRDNSPGRVPFRTLLLGQRMVLQRLRRGLTRVRPASHDREDRITRTEQPGAPPGTLTVEPDSPPPEIRAIAYGADDLTEQRIDDLGDLPELLDRWPVTWLNVEGLGDTGLIRELGELFGIHDLTLEDVVHVDQRAKAEVFPGYVFAVVRMVCRTEHLETEQLALLVGERFVVTFQEGHPGDCLDPVRRRLREGAGRLRSRGPAYLAYALIDAVTDHYFPVLERYGERLDTLEDEVLAHASDDIVPRIHEIKRDLLALKRTIAPQLDGIAMLRRDTTPLLDDETRLHLRDVADHTVQIAEMLDAYRETAAGLIDMHLSLANHQMNDVMKVLTVVGSVFIPLTFITGIYGMNFDPAASRWNMPELGSRYGYPAALAVMLVVTVGLLLYFRRRGWLGAPSRRS